jgi:hypothetical protein
MGLRANPEVRGAIVGLVLVVIGLLLMTVPAMAGLDGLGGGYALAVVGLVVTIAGAITVAFLLSRAMAVNRLLAGDGLLAHWTFDEPQRERQVRRDIRTQLAENRSLLLVMLGWWLLWVAIFAVIGYMDGNGDDMPLFIAIMAGVGGLLILAALGIPYLRARAARRTTPEAYVGRRGVLINGAYHSWQPPWAALDSVALRQDPTDARLVFSLRALTGPGWLHWVPYTIEVPVPPGEIAAAKRIVQDLVR